MENVNILLRKTIATSKPDEVAFIYIPKERVDRLILAARYGTDEIEEDGVTYSLTKEKLNMCFRKKTQSITKLSSWVLSIPPCSDKTITSVALESDPAHSMHDAVTAVHLPGRVSETVGMTVVHFFKEADADEFRRRLEIVAA
jgi:hypothetical protein